MPYKTGIRLLGVARNPDNGFPARPLDAPNLVLDGEAIRYVAQETMGGDLMTLTDEDSIVSRVKFEMWFSDKDRARPVLAYVTHS